MTESFDPVGDLLARWQEASGAATPESLCADRPDLLPDLRERIAALRAMDGWLATPDPAAGETPHVPAAARIPTPADATDRYRPVRPHAAGGLGEVLLADEPALGRPVALKRILPRRADDPASRARFVREAEITARLQHPGIVPVYGVGRDAAGRPCYAMRFVEGETLADALKRYHTSSASPRERAGELRRLLTRFVAACNAVAYAHSRGVVHRDLKPANIMLGPFGETLVVDWGLAKPFAQPAGDDAVHVPPAGDADDATADGAAVGTPAYMPPEQAAGRHADVGPAADVFGLGATLYAVVTGGPPYRAASSIEAMALAAAGVVPPARQVNPAVPRPLEAVCAKATAPAPADRYAGAADVAADVERWLADEPVRAEPEPLRDRARRWAVRHRVAVAAGVALLATAGVAATVTATVVVRQERVTAGERDRADTNFAVADEVATNLLTAVVDHPRLKAADFHTVRRDLLAQAVPLIERLAAAQGDDPRTLVGRARALDRLAVIRGELGETEQAVRDYRAAADLFAGLPPAAAADPAVRLDRGRVLTRYAQQLHALGRPAEAVGPAEAAVAALAALADRPDPRGDIASARGDAAAILAILRFLQGDPAEAERLFRAALAAHEAVPPVDGSRAKSRRGVAAVASNYGIFLRERRRHAEMVAQARAAVAAQQAVADASPDPVLERERLAYFLGNLGTALHDAGDDAGGVAMSEQAVAHLRALAAAFPKVPDHRERLARELNVQGVYLRESGRPGPADAAQRESLALHRAVAADFPAVPRYRRDLGLALVSEGTARAAFKDWAAADAAYAEARAVFAALVARHPDDRDFRADLADVALHRGESLGPRGDHPAALAEYAAALAAYERLHAERPDVGKYHETATQLLLYIGDCQGESAAAADWEKSLATYARVLADARAQLAANGALVRPRTMARNAHWGRAVSLEKLRRYADAVPEWEAAVAYSGGAARDEFRTFLALALARAGTTSRATALADELAATAMKAAGVVDAARVWALAPPADAAARTRRVVALLRRAAEVAPDKVAGIVADMRTDPDFDAVRDTPEFQRLLAELAAKGPPK